MCLYVTFGRLHVFKTFEHGVNFTFIYVQYINKCKYGYVLVLRGFLSVKDQVTIQVQQSVNDIGEQKRHMA